MRTRPAQADDATSSRRSIGVQEQERAGLGRTLRCWNRCVTVLESIWSAVQLDDLGATSALATCVIGLFRGVQQELESRP